MTPQDLLTYVAEAAMSSDPLEFVPYLNRALWLTSDVWNFDECKEKYGVILKATDPATGLTRLKIPQESRFGCSFGKPNVYPFEEAQRRVPIYLDDEARSLEASILPERCVIWERRGGSVFLTAAGWAAEQTMTFRSADGTIPARLDVQAYPLEFSVSGTDLMITTDPDPTISGTSTPATVLVSTVPELVHPFFTRRPQLIVDKTLSLWFRDHNDPVWTQREDAWVAGCLKVSNGRAAPSLGVSRRKWGYPTDTVPQSTPDDQQQ